MFLRASVRGDNPLRHCHLGARTLGCYGTGLLFHGPSSQCPPLSLSPSEMTTALEWHVIEIPNAHQERPSPSARKSLVLTANRRRRHRSPIRCLAELVLEFVTDCSEKKHSLGQPE